MRNILLLCLSFGLAACQTGDFTPADELALPRINQPLATGTKQMVATPHPLASQKALEVLNNGGHAVDAAVAAAVMLTLVEPESSGLGGGGFMLVYDAAGDKIRTYDGRETAPSSAHPTMFLKPNGKPMPFYDAVQSGRSIGVPGLTKMLYLAHKRYGKTKWYDLLMPTAHLADQGVPTPVRTKALLEADPYLRKSDTAADTFYDGLGLAKSVLRNPDLADTVHAIAVDGPPAFYADVVSDEIMAASGQALAISDLLRYQPIRRKPICGKYRRHVICGMAPPSGGGIVTLQTLKMLEKHSLQDKQPFGAQSVHLIAEALNMAYADRNKFIADPAYVPYNQQALVNWRYLNQRAKQLDPNRSQGKAKPGRPFGGRYQLADAGAVYEPTSTSHISIVDRRGNAVALTTSIENGFGSRKMAGGFLLNNQLTDFNFVPRIGGKPTANRAEPGKRPRSSMSPTLVFAPNGRLKMVLGSPGGPYITPYVVKTIIAVLDWGYGIQDAINAPNFANLNGKTTLEKGQFPPEVGQALRRMGHNVAYRPLVSGLNGIVLDQGRLYGGSDPRRTGRALGN